MPTYEYACKACGEHLEVVQSFRDEPLTTCPNCGGQLRKVFGAIGIAFKGSGFYKTDSRESTSGKTKAKAETKDKAEPAAAASSSSSSSSSSKDNAAAASTPAKSGEKSSGKGDSPKAAASS